ncbi:L,D-transpeptidase [Secundilactobacillus oryzae]|uniref:L,D-transpeptidase n=1 Tax=Secundilactobacillus oryzae TaxID=1202668 RepID=UPI0006D05A8F|nr:L,D-transpeptidase [Secundilactobacillus oryzae]
MKRLYRIVMTVIALALAAFLINHFVVQPHQSAALQQREAKVSKTDDKEKKLSQAENCELAEASQKKAYPNLDQLDNLWFKVSVKDQRVYVMSGAQVKYTMYCSTGKGNSTPIGTFHVEAERGTSFFNQESGEGANYWVSWKDHGIYLFHSVPVDKDGHYIKSEADRLGKEANSHGCVRLTIADAKWVYENAPYGMKVVITKS